MSALLAAQRHRWAQAHQEGLSTSRPSVLKVVDASSLPGPYPGSEPVLYSHTLCPFAQRTWLALVEKGVPHILVHIQLCKKPDWYGTVNPRRLVPVLQVDGAYVTESMDICKYVNEKFPGPSLLPEAHAKSISEHALRAMSALEAASLSLAAGDGRMSWEVGGSPSLRLYQSFWHAWEPLAAAIATGPGDFMGASTPTLVDIVAYPFVERAVLSLEEWGGVGALEELEGGARGLREWLSAMHSQSSVQLTSPDPELFLKTLRQHKRLDWFDYAPADKFQCHPHVQAHLE